MAWLGMAVAVTADGLAETKQLTEAEPAWLALSVDEIGNQVVSNGNCGQEPLQRSATGQRHAPGDLSAHVHKHRSHLNRSVVDTAYMSKDAPDGAARSGLAREA